MGKNVFYIFKKFPEIVSFLEFVIILISLFWILKILILYGALPQNIIP